MSILPVLVRAPCSVPTVGPSDRLTVIGENVYEASCIIGVPEHYDYARLQSCVLWRSPDTDECPDQVTGYRIRSNWIVAIAGAWLACTTAAFAQPKQLTDTSYVQNASKYWTAKQNAQQWKDAWAQLGKAATSADLARLFPEADFKVSDFVLGGTSVEIGDYRMRGYPGSLSAILDTTDKIEMVGWISNPHGSIHDARQVFNELREELQSEFGPPSDSSIHLTEEMYEWAKQRTGFSLVFSRSVRDVRLFYEPVRRRKK